MDMQDSRLEDSAIQLLWRVTKHFLIACTSANHSNTMPLLIREELKSIKTVRKEEWLVIGCTVWLFHWSRRHAITKAVREGLKLQGVTGSSVPRVASGENVWRYILEVYTDVPEVEQKAKKENVRLLPSIQILPGILSSDKPLTGSSEAFTSFKGASVPDKSVRRRGRRNVARGKRGGRRKSGHGDANRWWDDKHFSSQTLPELFSH